MTRISLLRMEWFTQYVTKRIEATRQDIYNLFDFWYQDILRLADRIGSVESFPRKANLQQNRSNTPTRSSRSPIEHYKQSVAIPLLDSLLLQMRERSNGGQDNVRALLCPLLTLLVRSDVDPMESVDGMLHWQADLPFPKSLRGEVGRWQSVWQSKYQEFKKQGKESKRARRPYPTTNLLLDLGACDSRLYPNVHRLLLIACRLPITSAKAERSFFSTEETED